MLENTGQKTNKKTDNTETKHKTEQEAKLSLG